LSEAENCWHELLSSSAAVGRPR